MKLYILDPIAPSGVDYLREKAPQAQLVFWDDPELPRWPEDADGLIVRLSPVAAEDISRAQRLRVIAKHGVGVENIDLDAAKNRGVIVANTPAVNSEAVAEQAVALSLAVARRLAEFDRRVRAGETVERADLIGSGFWQKPIGIIGMGNIATRVALKWRGAFDAQLFAYDPYAPEDQWSDIAHKRVTSLGDLLPEVELVTLHVPLTSETRHLIGERELAAMRPSGIVVNVSRGGIVDEAALYRAILEGQIFGAGLDVWEEEPPTFRNPLVGLPTVLVTPHAAGGTVDNQSNTGLEVARVLLAALEGATDINRMA